MQNFFVVSAMSARTMMSRMMVCAHIDLDRTNPHELRAFHISRIVRITRAIHCVMRSIGVDQREISRAKIVVLAAL